MSREPVCPSCGARLRSVERPCPQCGSRPAAPSAAPALAAQGADVFVTLTADEPTRIKSLLDRLVAAGIPFDPLGDLEADHADVDLELAGPAPLVSVRVLQSDLDRAQAVEAEWMREAHPEATAAIPLEGNSAESCPACDALLTHRAERCAACGAEIPAPEEAS